MTRSESTLVQAQAESRRSNTLFIGLGILGALIFTALIVMGQFRLAIMLGLAVPMIAVATVNIRAAIIIALVYLVFLGDLRRILIPVIGWEGQDPLLLVGSAFAIVLFAFAWSSRSVKLDTSLSWWTFALMGIMVLQIFNPKQGGLLVGVGGAMFYLVPLLWFWIGRTYATPAFTKALLYKVVVPLAVLAALMGYYQSFFDYLPYQMEWYEMARRAGYTALGHVGIQAPISFFASSTEYGNFLIIAIVVLWALVLKRKQWPALLLIVFFFVGVFLTGSRGPVVKVIFVCAGLWAVLGRTTHTWLMRGAVALLIGILGLTWSLSQLGDIGGNERIQHRVSRQAEGLLGAFEENSSSAGHFAMMVLGYKRALQEPLGLGLGATTKAAGKFGGRGGSTEVDFTDVTLSTGLFGGVVYHIMIVLIVLTAFRYWRRSRSLLALSLMGVVAVMFLLWLKGGQYAVSSLVWLCIGALDRLNKDDKEEED